MLQTSIRASVGTSVGRFFEFLKRGSSSRSLKEPMVFMKGQEKTSSLVIFLKIMVIYKN
jgi:hypothetical protein